MSCFRSLLAAAALLLSTAASGQVPATCLPKSVFPGQTGTDVLREIPWHKGTSEKELAPEGVPQHIWDWIRSMGVEPQPKVSPKVMKSFLQQMSARSGG